MFLVSRQPAPRSLDRRPGRDQRRQELPATTATARSVSFTTPSRAAISRREGNAYRLAQISVDIIDQCVAQGVPFAREYGGTAFDPLFRRSAGGRTFYARGQTGQQLLLGAYQALERQIAPGTVTMHSHTEMLDLVVAGGKARGIVTRNLRTGAVRSYSG